MVDVLLGLQWGDEGKGKIVDLLTEEIGAVVRFQGGHNAGHTLVVNGCECEPYLTCDHRVMVEHADDLIVGIRYAMRATGAVRTIDLDLMQWLKDWVRP